MLVEMVVISDDPMHFGTGEIQSLGNGGDRLGGDIPQTVLNGVEQGQECPGLAFIKRYTVFNNSLQGLG
jgi:hypothetical protein